MTKKEKLEKLDNALADAMLDIMESKEYDRLPDLATLSNYLAKNNRVEEKEKSSLEDDIKDKVEKAKKRREDS